MSDVEGKPSDILSDGLVNDILRPVQLPEQYKENIRRFERRHFIGKLFSQRSQLLVLVPNEAPLEMLKFSLYFSGSCIPVNLKLLLLPLPTLTQTVQSQNTTQKSISIAFCVSSIRHDSSLSKYRKQKQSPPWTCAVFSISRGVTASVYGTC